MSNYKIAVVPGDGIGNEIVPEGLRVIKAVAKKHNFSVETEEFGWGAGYYLKNNQFLPDNGIETLKAFDAVYFGSVGLPAVDDTLPAKDYTFKVRTHFNQYVNHRPVRTYPGVTRPIRSEKHIDFVIVRENNEGEFVQMGGQYLPDFENGMGIDTSVFTRKGIERVAHYAFKLARTRRNKVTHITKSNTLINSLSYWDRVIGEVAEQYPDVEHQQMYIDNSTAMFVLKPEQFDVVLTTNLFGDILSDLGGAIMGSLGLGGSGNINPEKEFPSMFEPIHGSAPDIAGQNIANPYGQIWSAALMLEHLGETEAANSIMEAIDKSTSQGVLTVDLGGSASTSDVADAVIANL
ncbi:isocitrate/isopropylmalate dehydrogenase family protein [Jejuia pallidilutea]|uniref:3-isopropylmalate dehydrogenase n=1 Tax=Jejuia pallidilutea TaxID=504487 RepID=A0A090W0N8_9FLAO|nr:isocitrate/isopropylmalate family dehydrogenase [Jejuia pallidilutea]GAL66745.1 3-isopropylmalate dehydrogenase [Jejuia pallidilutea]GAL70471.1 3-isopropylmalate dehydrogenase [Jejuia pallidilutea]GAL90534.1 3-isopropylmalate dehydrogenase [Jejuia pallidilutea]